MAEPLTFIPTRAAALARLDEFLPAAGRYAAERNYVRPGHDNISRLSPWGAIQGVMPYPEAGVTRFAHLGRF